MTNVAHRRAMGAWIERVVFSRALAGQAPAPLPFDTRDYRTRHLTLDEGNFYPVLQASGSIPFVLQAVHDIPGAPRGAYWDGGITDYHLHLAYGAAQNVAACAGGTGAEGRFDQESTSEGGIVLYPHFQQAVVPGWLDKGLKWRHRATPFLDHMLVLAPNPDWVRTLPGAKLPDRTDLQRLGHADRVRAWTGAVGAARQLADEFQDWLTRPDVARIRAL